MHAIRFRLGTRIFHRAQHDQMPSNLMVFIGETILAGILIKKCYLEYYLDKDREKKITTNLINRGASMIYIAELLN